MEACDGNMSEKIESEECMKIVSLIVLVSASIFLVACGGEESSAPPSAPANAVVESEAEEYVSEPSTDESIPHSSSLGVDRLPIPPEDDSHQPQGEAEEAPPFE